MLRVAAVFVSALVCVALAGQWKVLETDLEVFDTGIDFSDDNTGYTAGDDNSGPDIYKTTDGGNTWNSLNASFGIDVMLLDIACSGNSVVVSGVFGCYYSTDAGNTWNPSKGEYGPSQSIRAFGVNGASNFGVAGEFLEKNGVGISNDGGKTFFVQTPTLYTGARYGVYPSANTWYVTAGQWPNNENDSPLKRTELMGDNGRFPRVFDLKGPNNNLKGNGYRAQLVRTTDAGKSWTTVVGINETFYFNGIDCDSTNPNHCCAVGEAFDIPAAGAHIICTNDGVNWNRTFFEAQNGTHAYSLMEIRFSTPTSLWAVGAVLGQNMPSAWFLQSTDGGQTWAQASDLLPGLYAMSLTSPSATTSYASVDNTVMQKSGVAKYVA